VNKISTLISEVVEGIFEFKCMFSYSKSFARELNIFTVAGRSLNKFGTDMSMLFISYA
jgi:hypothetical protein